VPVFGLNSRFSVADSRVEQYLEGGVAVGGVTLRSLAFVVEPWLL
jgi:hypothetical protein